MRHFWRYLAIYVFGCLLGGGLVAWRSVRSAAQIQRVVFTVERPLPAGTMIGAGDISYDQAASTNRLATDPAVVKAQAALVGKYLKQPVDQHGTVLATAVAPTPDLKIQTDRMLAGFALADTDLAEAVNAGTFVILCSGDRQIGSARYQVAVKSCSGSACTGFLPLSLGDSGNAVLFGSGLPPRIETSSCLPQSPHAVAKPIAKSDKAS